MSKNKHKNQGNEANNNTQNQEGEEQMDNQNKVGFVTKVGSGIKKVVTSKPAKAIGVVLLVAGSAFGGFEFGKRRSGSKEDSYDHDYTDVTSTDDGSYDE